MTFASVACGDSAATIRLFRIDGRVGARCVVVPRRSRFYVAAVLIAAMSLGGNIVSAAARVAGAQVASVLPAGSPATAQPALAYDPVARATNLAYRSRSGSVLLRAFVDGVWSAPADLGGKIVGAPGLAQAGVLLSVFGRGTDGALWGKFRAATGWSSWQGLGGVLSAGPAAAGWSDGRVDVFVRGTDDALWTRTRQPNGSWTGWTGLGGRLDASPSAAAVGPGALSVAVVGSDHAVYRRSRAAGAWSGWARLGGLTYSAPTATADPATGQRMVFVRGVDNALWTYAGAGWASLGGRLVDGPAAVVSGSARIDVMVRGMDNRLYAKLRRNGSWSAWVQGWPAEAFPAPAAGLLDRDWTVIPTSAKVVALTFDAGGDAAGLAAIRATLQRKNVPATFFLKGGWVLSYPAEANEIVNAGFVVGNHTMTHPYLTQKSDAVVLSEVRQAESAIFNAAGAEARPLFRFPYGDVNSHVIDLVNSLGYVPVRWTVDTLGWKGMKDDKGVTTGITTATVIRRVLGGLRNGEIVLMHVGAAPDGTTLDAAALPTVIDQIQRAGYRFVTMRALTG